MFACGIRTVIQGRKECFPAGRKAVTFVLSGVEAGRSFMEASAELATDCFGELASAMSFGFGIRCVLFV